MPLILCCKGQFGSTVSEKLDRSHSSPHFTVGPTLHDGGGMSLDQRLRVKEATKQEPREAPAFSPVPVQCTVTTHQAARDLEAWRGRLVFLLNEDSCSCCHCVQRRGGELLFLGLFLLDRVLMTSSPGLKLLFTTLAGFPVLDAGPQPVPPKASLQVLSALSLWICSMRTACFWTHTFTFRHRLWYMGKSIFLDSRYCLRSSQRRILILFIQVTLWASATGSTLSLPMPICLPFQQAKCFFSITWMDSHRLSRWSAHLWSAWICWVTGVGIGNFCISSLGSNHFHSRGHTGGKLFWSLSIVRRLRPEVKGKLWHKLYMKQLTQIGRLPVWAWTNQRPLNEELSD